MKLSEKKLVVLAIAGVFILVSSLSAYWVLGKEQVKIVVKGEETQFTTFKKTVKELLEERNIKYDSDDKITPGLDMEVKDYMEIKVVEVTTNQQVEKEELPFEVKMEDDDTLLKGKTTVAQEGEAGSKELTYDLTYEDGKLVSKKLSKEVISKKPIEKIVKNGIKEEVIIASRGDVSRNITSNSSTQTKSSGSHMSVVATAYAGDTITSTGTVPRWGTIAVDPNVIPYGSKVYIPQFGMTFIAEDCGGAIKGNKIDIFMGSEGEAYSWGRRSIDIYIQ